MLGSRDAKHSCKEPIGTLLVVMTRRRLLSCSLGAALVLGSACAGPRDPGAAGSAPGSSTEPRASVMVEVLEFSAPKLGGGTVDGADYLGSDLAIWFWAPW